MSQSAGAAGSSGVRVYVCPLFVPYVCRCVGVQRAIGGEGIARRRAGRRGRQAGHAKEKENGMRRQAEGMLHVSRVRSADKRQRGHGIVVAAQRRTEARERRRATADSRAERGGAEMRRGEMFLLLPALPPPSHFPPSLPPNTGRMVGR